MSQEINLLNPALRPKRDWLSFRNVALAAGVAVLATAISIAFAHYQLAVRESELAAVGVRLAQSRQAMQSMQGTLAGRKSDTSLTQEVERLENSLRQRREVLKLAQGLAAESGSVAEVMRGLARQRLEGLWLVGFGIGPDGFDLNGRTLDPSLLPVYIRRLNAEPAFRGRRFAALDMQGFEAGAPVAAAVLEQGGAKGALASGGEMPPAAGGSAPAVAVAAVRYAEFALRATLPKPPVETPGKMQ